VGFNHPNILANYGYQNEQTNYQLFEMFGTPLAQQLETRSEK